MDLNDVAVRFGVTIQTLAKMIGTDERTLRTQLDSAGVQRSLNELALAYDGLGIMLPADEIPRWMHCPVPALGGRTPIALAREDGAASLRRLVAEMTAGGYS